MAFPTWNDDEHVVEPFEIPEHWPRIRAIDWGSAAPWCCLWAAVNPDNGRHIVYREAYQAGLTDRQQAVTINNMTPAYEDIKVTYADPSMWAKKTLDEVTSTEEVYRKNGISLTEADNDRISGKRKVERLLAPLPDGAPGLIIFSNCKNLRRTLPELVRDEINAEDVDTDGEDHSYDTLRYSAHVSQGRAKQEARNYQGQAIPGRVDGGKHAETNEPAQNKQHQIASRGTEVKVRGEGCHVQKNWKICTCWITGLIKPDSYIKEAPPHPIRGMRCKAWSG